MTLNARTGSPGYRDLEREALEVVGSVRRAIQALGLPGVTLAGGAARGRAADLPEVERLAVESAVEGRRQEFAAGRRYAREALGALGVHSATLPRRAGGDPQWPLDVCGSITHGGGLCLALTGHTGEVAALGIDVELARPLESAIWGEICSPVELVWLRAAGRWEPGILALMLLCAKEAGYKAQYPLTNTFVELSSVTTRLDPFSGSFDMILSADLRPLLEFRRIQGVVARVASYVVAVAYVGTEQTSSDGGFRVRDWLQNQQSRSEHEGAAWYER